MLESTGIYDNDNNRAFIFLENKNDIEILEIELVYCISKLINEARKNAKSYIDYKYLNSFREYKSFAKFI